MSIKRVNSKYTGKDKQLIKSLKNKTEKELSQEDINKLVILLAKKQGIIK